MHGGQRKGLSLRSEVERAPVLLAKDERHGFARHRDAANAD